MSIETRFWTKVARTGNACECWEWTASKDRHGYGQFMLKDKDLWRAHRVSYILTHGEIPAGLDLDHVCRNRSCVNPAHLEPVTRSENLRRGDHRWRDAKTCIRGHEFIVRPGAKQRICLECEREASRRKRARRAALRISSNF